MNTDTDTTQTDNKSQDAAGDKQDGAQDQTGEKGDSSQDKGKAEDSSEQSQSDKGDSSQNQDGEADKGDKGEKEKGDKQEPTTFDENEELGVPSEYAPLDAPEGFEMSDEQKARVNEFAKSTKMNNFQRNQALKFHTDVMTELNAAAEANRKATFDQWDEATKTDPELSGMNQGTTKEEIDSVMQRGMDSLSEPAVQEADGEGFKKGEAIKDGNGQNVSRITKLATETGMIHNPEFRRVMYRAGKLIRPDTIIGGNTEPNPNEGKSGADILFPNQGKDSK